MKVFIIGGTGLLGSIAARKLIEDGHHVTSIALPPIPKGAPIPKSMNLILNNYMAMSDDEIVSLMQDCEVFVFAAGIDERVEGKSPIYELYEKYNILPLKRLLGLAKQAGVKRSVVLGSYFSYFDRVWRDLDLYHHHPYIRSRIDQANMALSFQDEHMKVAILELPYIFGVQKGRKPVWVFLVEQIRKMRFFTFYPDGGTAMLTCEQVGEVISKVAQGDYSGNIPVGYYNLTWKQMLAIFHKEMGIDRKIISISKWIYKLALQSVKRRYKKNSIESGLDFSGLAEIMSRNAFIDPSFIKDELHVHEDNIEEAIAASVKLSLEIIEDKPDIVDMKAE
ncbi:MAG TPA: NAD(P)-dependent oxidoreductase [Bacillota bacterium]|nr:NAD(P)-dependent oxidoreductase [Bacillota bacterium]HPJ23388.1 NAD(P)-dependent oxidoreductase [Bacillota bacterium]